MVTTAGCTTSQSTTDHLDSDWHRNFSDLPTTKTFGEPTLPGPIEGGMGMEVAPGAADTALPQAVKSTAMEVSSGFRACRR
jgi:hypothetical protein